MNLGGGIQGFSPTQTSGNEKSADDVMLRRIVTKSWNTPYANGVYGGKKRAIGPFRAITNTGDFLSRDNYSCGGSNAVNSRPGLYGLMLRSIPQNCDGTGIPPSATNTKYVPDSSDYITYKKQRQANLMYNDLANVGPAVTYTHHTFGLWSLH